jgi:hypothetical protein
LGQTQNNKLKYSLIFENIFQKYIRAVLKPVFASYFAGKECLTGKIRFHSDDTAPPAKGLPGAEGAFIVDSVYDIKNNRATYSE